MNYTASFKAPVPFRLCATTTAVLFCLLPLSSVEAQENMLDEIAVSASRTAERIMDTAASISVVNTAQIHDGQAEQNLSEVLQRSPGIFALNRQNYAQDLLISSRGFGANSTFGARGIKIIVDGIPGTVADGQSQISHIDLASADHVEIMRGPFSSLYGNSAGGVINVFTESGKPGVQVTPYFSAGANGQRKYGLKVAGETDNINYVLDDGSLHTDGYRAHSAADRDNKNAKVAFKLAEDTSVTLVANNLSLSAQDPLGLTAAQLQSNPRAAGTGAIADNTRKTVEQTQGGMVLSQRIGSNDTVTITPYYGERHTIQYLASAVNNEINLHRTFDGVNSNWLHTTDIAGMPLKLVAGLESNQNSDHRQTYSGLPPTATVQQDYAMQAKNLDEYLQGELRPTAQLALTAGVRQSETTLSANSNNALLSLGSHDYQATTGMASAQYYLSDNSNVYLSYGTGFDTPTLNQILYSSNYVNSAGTNTGNIGLQAARTRQLEIGYKGEISSTAQVKVALFDAETRNDIVIADSNSGKTSYMNAPQTRRQGLELDAQWQLPHQFQASVAYTRLNATVTQTYSEKIGSTNTIINSGNRIPGVPDQGLYTELMWKKADQSLEYALEGRAAGSIAANDVNQASSAGYAIVNLRAITRQKAGKWLFTEFARVDNLFDRAYVGSVIVNQASSQYYESAPGRNWLLGINAAYKF